MHPTNTSLQVIPIDLGYYGLVEGAAAFLIPNSEDHILIECGPAHCLPRLSAGLQSQGLALEEIKHVLVTHIHLDHAGAAGEVTAAGAQLYVHPRGARHLIDPTKLNASARQVFEDELDTRLGELTPSPADQVHAIADGAQVTLGPLTCEAIETFGHANHHHAWLISNSSERHLFVGDIAAMRIPGSDFATLPMFAPEFDLDVWLNSIDRIRALDFDAMWLTHFGRVDDPNAFLDHVTTRLKEESNFITELMNTAPDATPDDFFPTYRAWHLDQAAAHGISPEQLDQYCDKRHYRANIVGVRRWRHKSD